jgi:replicative DNA helicase
MVMFIYRPEYYEIDSNENGESTRGETHIRIAKHRNGTLETIKLRALLHIQKFEEWDNPMHGTSGNWRPITPPKDYTEPKRFSSFDDGFTEDQPF